MQGAVDAKAIMKAYSKLTDENKKAVRQLIADLKATEQSQEPSADSQE